MDEISNGLDYRSMMELQELINDWSSRMTIVAAGHQFEFILQSSINYTC
ncbi:hypothetical protein PO124_29470 [Bacillus licheniformis]|nr:hypothetical protein [Bacillus licheniformis]